jgi:hypothetical protein
MGVRPPLGGGGGIPAGLPDSLPFYNPAGNGLLTSAGLLAGKADAYGRPCIWDFRSGGAGAIYRNGAWTTDGDPVDVAGDGAVFIGPDSTGAFAAGIGAIARIKSTRFAIVDYPAAFPAGYNLLRIDPAAIVYKALIGGAPVDVFKVDRATYQASLLGAFGTVPMRALPAPFVRSVNCTGLQDVLIYGGGNPAPCKLIVGGVHVFIPPGPPPAGQAQAFNLPGGAGQPVTMQGAGWSPGNIPLAGAFGNFIPNGGGCYWNTANPAFWIPGIVLNFLMIPVP